MTFGTPPSLCFRRRSTTGLKTDPRRTVTLSDCLLYDDTDPGITEGLRITVWGWSSQPSGTFTVAEFPPPFCPSQPPPPSPVPPLPNQPSPLSGVAQWSRSILSRFHLPLVNTNYPFNFYYVCHSNSNSNELECILTKSRFLLSRCHWPTKHFPPRFVPQPGCQATMPKYTFGLPQTGHWLAGGGGSSIIWKVLTPYVSSVEVALARATGRVFMFHESPLFFSLTNFF